MPSRPTLGLLYPLINLAVRFNERVIVAGDGLSENGIEGVCDGHSVGSGSGFSTVRDSVLSDPPIHSFNLRITQTCPHR